MDKDLEIEEIDLDCSLNQNSANFATTTSTPQSMIVLILGK